MGAGYEYLFSNGNSFHGANIDAGIGMDYALSDTLAIGFEPISAQVMVWRSESTIPMNVRGQVLLSVRARW